MSVDAFAREWTAKVAPIEEPQLQWEDGKLVRESFAEHALREVRSGEVPVVVAHDEDLRVGYIDQVWPHDGWFQAAFRLDRTFPGAAIAAEYVRRGMPVSIGFRTWVPMRNENTVEHRVVRLDELSILGVGMKPAYKGAEIVSSRHCSERGRVVHKEPTVFPEAAATTSEPPNVPVPNRHQHQTNVAGEDFDDYRRQCGTSSSASSATESPTRTRSRRSSRPTVDRWTSSTTNGRPRRGRPSRRRSFDLASARCSECVDGSPGAS